MAEQGPGTTEPGPDTTEYGPETRVTLTWTMEEITTYRATVSLGELFEKVHPDRIEVIEACLAPGGGGLEDALQVGEKADWLDDTDLHEVEAEDAEEIYYSGTGRTITAVEMSQTGPQADAPAAADQPASNAAPAATPTPSAPSTR